MEKAIDSHIPYLYVDASYFKVRDGVRYVRKALLVVVGVRTDGYREILGTRVAETLKECLSDSGRRFYSNIETLPNITRRSYSRSVGRSPGFLSIILPLLLPQALFITIPGCLSC